MQEGPVMPKSVPPKVGPAGAILAENFAKIGPPGPLLLPKLVRPDRFWRRTDFFVTGLMIPTTVIYTVIISFHDEHKTNGPH